VPRRPRARTNSTAPTMSPKMAQGILSHINPNSAVAFPYTRLGIPSMLPVAASDSTPTPAPPSAAATSARGHVRGPKRRAKATG
jgi:hypothetical protein